MRIMDALIKALEARGISINIVEDKQARKTCLLASTLNLALAEYADFPYRDWPVSQFGGQMSYPLCRNYCVLSECAVIQTQTAVAGR